MNIFAKLKLIIHRSYSNADNKEIVKATTIIFCTKVFFALIGFLTNVVIARTLNVADAGYYFFMISVISLLATFSLMGLDNAIVNFIAKANSKGDFYQVKHVFALSIKIALYMSLMVAALLYLFNLYVYDVFFNNVGYKTPLFWAVFIIPLVCLFTVFIRSFQGVKLINQFAFFNGITRLLTFIGLLLLAIFYGRLFIEQMYWLYFMSSLLALILVYVSWRNFNANNMSLIHTKQQSLNITHFNSRYYRYCFSVWGISCLAIIMGQGVQILLALLSGVEQVAYFAIANRIALLVAFVLVAINGILSPKFAEISAEGNSQRLQQVYRSSTRLMLLVTSPLLIIVFVFSTDILMLFGEQYKNATLALRVLIMAQLVKVMVGSVGQLLIMSGFVRSQNVNLVIAVVILIIGSIILVPHYGALGGAIATLGAVVANNLLGLYAVRKKLNISLF